MVCIITLLLISQPIFAIVTCSLPHMTTIMTTTAKRTAPLHLKGPGGIVDVIGQILTDFITVDNRIHLLMASTGTHLKDIYIH